MNLLAAVIYGVSSLVTLIAYAVDKSAARRGGRRIPEATLHLLELLGGWPGALLAQRLFRHKSVKISYNVALWLIIAAHAGGWWVALRA